MAEIQYYGTGRRKSATARVYLRPGAGEVKVNHKPFDRYFPNETRDDHRQPLQLTEPQISLTSSSRRCGGPAGQAGAIRHGITRALLEYNADLRPFSSMPAWYSRSRIKERKKYGQKGARKRFHSRNVKTFPIPIAKFENQQWQLTIGNNSIVRSTIGCLR